MSQNSSSIGPKAWLAGEVRGDASWIRQLSSEDIAGLDMALDHARRVDKPPLSMSQADFPLNASAKSALAAAVATTQGRWGMCLLRGFPVDRWTEDDCRLATWGMGLHMGVARTQNRASQIMNDVRDEGGSYKVKGGRGYNTNAGLDFHQDSCDVVALLCRRTARTGGTSKVVSSIAVRDEIVRTHPELIAVLQGPWYHSYQGAQDPSQPPFYECPILGGDPEHFAMRTNRKNTDAAQRDFEDAPRLTDAQRVTLDLLDSLLPDPRFCFTMTLERGDMQLLNSHVTLHSRTPFEDFDEADQKRHLFRLWMSIPGSQPLPPEWESYYGDVRAGSVRGGVRGSAITSEFVAYERRQAAAMHMHLKPWAPPSPMSTMAGAKEAAR